MKRGLTTRSELSELRFHSPFESKSSRAFASWFSVTFQHSAYRLPLPITCGACFVVLSESGREHAHFTYAICCEAALLKKHTHKMYAIFVRCSPLTRFARLGMVRKNLLQVESKHTSKHGYVNENIQFYCCLAPSSQVCFSLWSCSCLLLLWQKRTPPNCLGTDLYEKCPYRTPHSHMQTSHQWHSLRRLTRQWLPTAQPNVSGTFHSTTCLRRPHAPPSTTPTSISPEFTSKCRFDKLFLFFLYWPTF